MIVQTKFKDLTFDEIQGMYSVPLVVMTPAIWESLRGKPTQIETPPVEIQSPTEHTTCKGPFFRLYPHLILKTNYVAVCGCVVEIGD